MNNELIEFCMWFCGYDRETMEQVYNDWLAVVNNQSNDKRSINSNRKSRFS